MEDWTNKKPIFIKPNDWQTNLIIQEIQGQEAKERILKGEIEFHLREYEKDIRKQVCEEIWKEFEQRLMNKTEDMTVMKVANMINSVLDKIKGE